MADRRSDMDEAAARQELARLVCTYGPSVGPLPKTAEVVHNAKREIFIDIPSAMHAFCDKSPGEAEPVEVTFDGRTVARWWIEDGVPHFADFVEGGGYLECVGEAARARLREIVADATMLRELRRRLDGLS